MLSISKPLRLGSHGQAHIVISLMLLLSVEEFSYWSLEIPRLRMLENHICQQFRPGNPVSDGSEGL